MQWRRETSALFAVLGCAACGPEPALPLSTDELFVGHSVVLDPDGWVPFGAPPVFLEPSLGRNGAMLAFEPPAGSLAGAWRVLGESPEGVFELERFGAAGEVDASGWDRLGVQAISGAYLGPVVWEDAGSGRSGLGDASPPVWKRTPMPLGTDDGVLLVRADVEVRLLDPAGPDLSGTARLELDLATSTDAVGLAAWGEVTEVRDAMGASLVFTAGPAGVGVELGAPRTGALTLEVDWTVADLTAEEAGRRVADAVDGRAFVGDPRPWFPRPLGAPTAGTTLALVFDVPEGAAVYSAGAGPTRAAGGPGRELVSFLSTDPLSIWPLFAAGDYLEATTAGGVTVAAWPEATPDLTELTSFVGAAEAAYVETFGPLPGGRTVLVQAPDAFALGFSGPGLAFIPWVTWDGAPSRSEAFLLAHELSHAWWAHGTLLGPPLDAWLTEGLADYSAARALRAARGEAVEREQTAADLELLVDLMTNGFGGEPGRDVPVRPDSVDDLQDYVFYLKGAAVLRYLERVVSTDHLDAALSTYHRATLHRPADTAGFETAVEAAYGSDLAWFFDPWLRGTGLPELAVEPFFRREGDAVRVALGLGQRTAVGGTPAGPWQLVFDVEARAGDGVLDRGVACTSAASEVVEVSGGCRP